MALGWYVIDPPDTGVLATAVKKAAFASAGTQPVTGGLDVTVPKIATAMVGYAPPSGNIYAQAQTAVASLFGAQEQSAAAAVSLPKATMALIGSQAQSGTLAGLAKRANAALAGTVVNYGGLIATAKKAGAAFAGSQSQLGSMAAAMQKATALMFDGSSFGGMSASLARATAGLAGYQEQTGGFATNLPKATALLGGLEHPMGTIDSLMKINAFAGIGGQEQSATFAAALQKAVAAMAGGQAQAGGATGLMKRPTFAASSSLPVTFDKASTYTNCSANQATWDGNCVLTGVTAGATIVLALILPGAGGGVDIDNSNYVYTITTSNGSPTWTKRNPGMVNNGSSHGGVLFFTAQNVNAGNHTVRLQQTVNNGSWVSVPMLCAISVLNVVSIVNRQSSGVYPGGNTQTQFGPTLTAGANSLDVLCVGTDAVQQSGISGGTVRVSGGANNTSAYYIADFGMIITAPGPNPAISAAANVQYNCWSALELVGA